MLQRDNKKTGQLERERIVLLFWLKLTSGTWSFLYISLREKNNPEVLNYTSLGKYP